MNSDELTLLQELVVSTEPRTKRRRLFTAHEAVI
jgi:hypothetical protein